MKGTFWGISLIICTVLSFKLCNIIIATVLQASTVHQFEINFDPYFSATTKQQIHDFVAQEIINNNSSCAQAITLLKNQFPYIQYGSATKRPQALLEITLACHKPWRSINNALIMCKNGLTLPANTYHQECLQSIPNITVPASSLETNYQLCMPFLEQITNELCNKFQVTWLHNNKSLLHDKEQPLFSLVVNNHEKITQQLLEKCALIKNDLNTKGVFKGTRAKQWFADLRFKNQIIVHAQKKGEM